MNKNTRENIVFVMALLLMLAVRVIAEWAGIHSLTLP